MSKLIKTVIASSHGTIIPTIDEIHGLLDELYSSVRSEADRAKSGGNFEFAAAIYSMVSKLLLRCASLMKDTHIYEVLSTGSASWSVHAQAMSHSAISYYLDKVRILEGEGNYEESTIYKNKAKFLEYEVQNDYFYRRIDVEVDHFVKLRQIEASQEDESRRQQGFLKSLASGARGFLKAKTSQEQEHPVGEKSKATSVEQKTPDLERNTLPVLMTIQQAVKRSGRGQEWRDWSVWIDSDDRDLLKNIKNVTYTLHPTFRNPKRVITDPASQFMLSATGWADFEIRADIALNNGDKITKYHWLNLHSDTQTNKPLKQL